jgi:hypothetical protein
MGFTVRINASSLGLKELKAGAVAAARPAAQAGAEVFDQEVKRNVGRIRKRTGNLAASNYQAYSKDSSTDSRAVYHVSWNAKKAPHGHLVEYGHLQRYRVIRDEATGRLITLKDQPLAQPEVVAARPFMRPAVVVAPAAEKAIIDRFDKELQDRGLL